ncbi:hypothetical protein MIMGU_mgv1a016977mg [Erythranthe guttata]|uniref:Uncharacterized protein n=1 Tax=Erythranthe guttata TaxID=4155 RepID=A0A022S4F3_ERYGU|nr:hypothetical protein MIMGU_mgv1a016977mg [Erythranthe guttata]
MVSHVRIDVLCVGSRYAENGAARGVKLANLIIPTSDELSNWGSGHVSAAEARGGPPWWTGSYRHPAVAEQQTLRPTQLELCNFPFFLYIYIFFSFLDY